eukprot:scaffold18_cov401-Prasinococcus_capsulatus_cf.AAC.6
MLLGDHLLSSLPVVACPGQRPAPDHVCIHGTICGPAPRLGQQRALIAVASQLASLLPPLAARLHDVTRTRTTAPL